MNESVTVVFLCLLAVTAFLYASVGHGGASGYLALGALFSVQAIVMKPSALILNIIVSGVAFFQYYRGGHFKWKLFWPFAITSVPAAFLGSFITLDETLYKKILGALLLFAVLRIAGIFGKGKSEIKKPVLWIALATGGAIGLLSGMIGIGGGIILTPVLILMGWAGLKETAAVSAIFILVNSISGLSGMMTKGLNIPDEVFVWLVVAALGGFAGSWAGSFRFGGFALRGMLALTLAIACFKLILT